MHDTFSVDQAEHIQITMETIAPTASCRAHAQVSNINRGTYVLTQADAFKGRDIKDIPEVQPDKRDYKAFS